MWLLAAKLKFYCKFLWNSFKIANFEFQAGLYGKILMTFQVNVWLLPPPLFLIIEAARFLDTFLTPYHSIRCHEKQCHKYKERRSVTEYDAALYIQNFTASNPKAVTLNHRRHDFRELRFFSEVIWRVIVVWCNFMPHCSLSIRLTLGNCFLNVHRNVKQENTLNDMDLLSVCFSLFNWHMTKGRLCCHQFATALCLYYLLESFSVFLRKNRRHLSAENVRSKGR
jgi:hypothetical protein